MEFNKYVPAVVQRNIVESPKIDVVVVVVVVFASLSYYLPYKCIVIPHFALNSSF